MSDRLGSVMEALVLIAFSAGLTSAVTLVSTVDGGAYRFDNSSAATAHSRMLNTFYGERNPEECDEPFPVPLSSTEIQLIVEVVNKKADGHQIRLTISSLSADSPDISKTG